MAWTALWMAGLCVAVGAVVFEVAGLGWAVAGVGVTMAVEGVFADLTVDGPLPRRRRGSEPGEGVA